MHGREDRVKGLLQTGTDPGDRGYSPWVTRGPLVAPLQEEGAVGCRSDGKGSSLTLVGVRILAQLLVHVIRALCCSSSSGLVSSFFYLFLLLSSFFLSSAGVESQRLPPM